MDLETWEAAKMEALNKAVQDLTAYLHSAEAKTRIAEAMEQGKRAAANNPEINRIKAETAQLKAVDAIFRRETI